MEKANSHPGHASIPTLARGRGAADNNRDAEEGHTMPPVLVVGTRNPKKREEILEILGDLGLELRDLTAYPDAPEVVEDGATFADNARKKAVELARHLGQWVLGEDSGLIVPALNGRPGVYSARYAGKQGDDAANNARLLAELAPLPDDRRAAYYVCHAAVADPTGTVRATAEGRCHGVIVRDARGTGGFGYDPLFLIPEFHRTFGELSARVKHALSHRARALEQLRPALRQLGLTEHGGL
jgi:XTP/dITP diphosphohydrolase